jgi:hypothetical protein
VEIQSRRTARGSTDEDAAQTVAAASALTDGVCSEEIESFASIITGIQAELVMARNAPANGLDSGQSATADQGVLVRLDISGRAGQSDILIRLRRQVVGTDVQPQGLLVNINVNDQVRERHMLMRPQRLAGQPRGIIFNYDVSGPAGQRQMLLRPVNSSPSVHSQRQLDDSFLIEHVDSGGNEHPSGPMATPRTENIGVEPADSEVAHWSGIVRVFNIDLRI